MPSARTRERSRKRASRSWDAWGPPAFGLLHHTWAAAAPSASAFRCTLEGMRAFVLVAFALSCSIYDKSLLSGDGGIPVEAGPCGTKTMCVKACVDTQT